MQDRRAPVDYVYSWGIGVESQLVAERNAFRVPHGFPNDQVIRRFNGNSLAAHDNRVNGEPVDLLAAYNAVHDPDLSEVPAWSPLLRRTVHPVSAVPRVSSPRPARAD